MELFFADNLGYIPLDVFQSVLLVTIVAHNADRVGVQLFSTLDPINHLAKLLENILDDCERGVIKVTGRPA